MVGKNAMRKYWLICFLFVALIMAACDNAGTPDLPTLFPTEGVAPLVATDVPTEVPVDPVDTNTPTPVERQALPPTWTNTPEPTVTPAEPTPTIEIATIEGVSSACDSFGPDREKNNRNFPLGTAPQVFWLPVEGAVAYQVSLFNEFGLEIHVAYVAETSYAFPAELFEAGKGYGWEVYPRDDRAVQMCYGRGDELLPFTQP